MGARRRRIVIPSDRRKRLGRSYAWNGKTNLSVVEVYEVRWWEVVHEGPHTGFRVGA